MSLSSASTDVRISFCDSLEGDRYLDAPKEANKVQWVCYDVLKPSQGVIYVYYGLHSQEASAVRKELD